MIDFGSAPGPHGIGCVGPDDFGFSLLVFFLFYFGLAYQTLVSRALT